MFCIKYGYGPTFRTAMLMQKQMRPALWLTPSYPSFFFSKGAGQLPEGENLAQPEKRLQFSAFARKERDYSVDPREAIKKR